ncbi:hypothetical protein Q4R38_19150 [Morganella morganii]|nr:hypothetical protein [Morganella morganii]
MNSEKYKLYVEIIKRCRDCTEFTNKTVSAVIGVDTRKTSIYMREMESIGCVKTVGRRVIRGYLSPVYQFDDNAVTRLRNHFLTEAMPEAAMNIIAAEKIPVPKIRKHPFEDGFGRSLITEIDAMLREARRGMPTVQ